MVLLLFSGLSLSFAEAIQANAPGDSWPPCENPRKPPGLGVVGILLSWSVIPPKSLSSRPSIVDRLGFVGGGYVLSPWRCNNALVAALAALRQIALARIAIVT